MNNYWITSFPRATAFCGNVYDFLTDEDLVAFTVTAIASGTAAVINDATAGNNGICQISSVDATENKGAQLQVDAETFQPAVGRDLFFTVGVTLSEVTESDFFAGLIVADNSIEASAPSNGIYFSKVDGSTALKLNVRRGSAVDLDQTVGTFGTGYQQLAFAVTTQSSTSSVITVFQNGTPIATVNLNAAPIAAALTPSVAFQSGAAAIQTANVDYIGAWQTR